MSTYVVKAGDCLSSLAQRFGLPSWKTIYDHPENADFRELRPNPNLIYPGDRVFIPTPSLKEEPGTTESRHRYAVRRDRTLLRLRLKDAQGEPMANRAYVLTIGGRDIEGTTAGDGLLEETIPALATDGVLQVAATEDDPNVRVEWRIGIGQLDPVETLKGVQARLNNLGYTCGPVDGLMGPLTEGAVRRFQEDHDLTVDGIPGPNTQGKLEQLHDM
jgi:N-acetylmuramoyl-L-alanine amidase